ncbi:MAG: hypothetical protein R3A79_19545 [Nannocystaceae bacterium]
MSGARDLALAGLCGLACGCVLDNPNFHESEATAVSGLSESTGGTTGASTSSAAASTDPSAGTRGESDGATMTTSASGETTGFGTTTSDVSASASTAATDASTTDATTTDASTTDASTTGDATTGDAEACDLSPGAWSFGPIEALDAVNSQYSEADPVLLSDGLTLFFSTNRPGVQGQFDSFRATRAAFGEPFAAPVDNEATYGWNSPYDESKVDLRGDRLEVILTSNSMNQSYELLRGTRDTLEEGFSPLQPMPAIAGYPDADLDPHLSDDGHRLYFARRSGGQLDIVVSGRASLDEPFAAPTPIAALNTADSEANPTLSDDERRIFFARLVGGQIDIYTAWRDDRNMTFGAPEAVDALNTLGADAEPYLAEVDGECELFFVSDRLGQSWDLFRAPIVAP